ncbi:MAG: DUF2206 domain-containing protein [Candidatus Bathyarchaeia archaeon]
MLNIKKLALVIPIIIISANLAIVFDISIFREIVVFIFLSFIPGFAILRFFKLKGLTSLDNILFSIALSIAFLMFVGLLVNTLYRFIGLSLSLSTIPLTLGISAFTIALFFLDYKRNLPQNLSLDTIPQNQIKAVIPMFIFLFILPVLTAWAVLHSDIIVILISQAIVAALCILPVVSRKIVPETLFPFLIFSISIVLIFQVLLTSKYILGYDATTEYYVFRLTQIRGHWEILDANTYEPTWQNYNMMLSITLLPAVYSAVMHAEAGMVFKILYPFINCLIPLALYRIYEQQFGKLTGLLSSLFFISTAAAFYGLEPLSLNRQIVGGLFFLLSISLLTSKTLAVTKKRLLLIIFGAALAVSHYTLAYIFLGAMTLVFTISKIKQEFGHTLNSTTLLFLFAVTFSWYSIGSSSPVTSLTNTLKNTLIELVTGWLPNRAVTPSYLFFVPTVFTVATWFNMLVTGIANLLLFVGSLILLLKPKGKVSPDYRVLMNIAVLLLLVSFVAPRIATSINFTRLYGITLFFLAPAFVIGGQKILATITKALMKIKRYSNSLSELKIKNVNIAFLLISLLLSGYFLSQVGFVNYVTNSAIHSYPTDFQRMIKSDDIQTKITLYGAYIPEQDVFSASWLQKNKPESAEVFCDYGLGAHAPIGYGLIPSYLLSPLTNTTIFSKSSFIYLATLNVECGVTAWSETGGDLISGQFLDQNTVYSNANSVVYYVISDD